MDIGGDVHQNLPLADDHSTMVGEVGSTQRGPPVVGPPEISTTTSSTTQNRPRPAVSDQRRSPVDHPTPFIRRIQVSDLAGVSKIEETLDAKSKNWAIWSQSMHLMLDIVNAGKYVEGTVKQPHSERDPVSAENWHFNDTYMRVLIAKNIAPSEKCHIRGCETADEMWNNLRKIHECTSFQIQTEQRRVFRNMKVRDGDDIPQHLIKMKNQCNMIKDFGEVEECERYNDAVFKRDIASSLPRSWDTFTSPYVKGYVDENPLRSDAMKKIDSQQFIGIINQEYDLQQTRKEEENKIPPKGEKNSSPSENRTKREENTEEKTPRAKQQCKQCGRKGHYTSQCRFLGQNKCRKCGYFSHDIDQCNQNEKRSRNQNNSGNSYQKKRKCETHNAEEDEDTSPSANNVAALTAPVLSMNAQKKRKVLGDFDDYNKSSICDMSDESQNDDLYEWLTDTGTTAHITYRRDTFSTYETLPKIPISGVGELSTFTIGRGTIYLHSECEGKPYILQLNNVLHILKNRNNLLSLGRWEAQHKRKISIDNGHLSLRAKDGTSVAHGKRLSNNLYRITFRVTKAPSEQPLAFNATGYAPSWVIWHRHFGHVGYSGLLKLLEKRLVDGLNVDTTSDRPDCVACVEGKMLTSPYGPSSKRFSEPGELTHVDLWGKYHIASIHGNYYYLLMVDDASQHVTVEFLKTKDQANERIKNYVTYLMARRRSPCAIRMDRGKEFDNESFFFFFFFFF